MENPPHGIVAHGVLNPIASYLRPHERQSNVMESSIFVMLS